MGFHLSNRQPPREELLDKANSSAMNVKRVHFLCMEIYKTINNLNTSFMEQIFELRETSRSVRENYRLNLIIPNYNEVTFGKKSLKIFRAENLEQFTLPHWIFKKSWIQWMPVLSVLIIYNIIYNNIVC